MNKAIKKIVAFGVGASMLLGTAASAVLAADLSAYPSPFVQNGVFSGKIVIGEKAASIDTVGALDIAASLQRAATTVVSSAGAATQVEGSLRLDTSSDRIYYNEGFSIDSATTGDLTMLADGTFEDEEGTSFDFTQSIVFSKTKLLTYGHADGESDTDAFEAFEIGTSPTTAPLYTSKVTFTKAVNANSSNVIGNKIVLFGNEYTFSGDTEAGKLVLYGSSEEISIGMGEEVTKTVSNKEYKIKVIGFSTTKVTVQVNGETYSLAEEATKTFGGANGLRIYAKSVDSWDGGNAGTTGFATLQLGAEKIVLENGQAVALGTSETEIDGTNVELGGSVTALTSISINVTGDDTDTDFIKAGGSFVDPVWKTFKIVYGGNTVALKDASADMIEVAESSNSRLLLKLPTADGVKTLNLWGNGTNGLKWDSSKKILPFEGAIAAEDDYTYLASGDQKYTHFVQVKNIKLGVTDGYVEYQDVLTGQEFKTVEGNLTGAGNMLTLSADGSTYNVYMNDTTHVAVMKADSKLVIFPEVELKNGETFFFTEGFAPNTAIYNGVATATVVQWPGGMNGLAGTGTNATVGYVAYVFTGPTANLTALTADGAGALAVRVKEPKDYLGNYTLVTMPITAEGTDNPGLATVTFGNPTNVNGVSMASDNVYTGVDYFGTYVEKETPSGDDDNSITLYVPADQVYANVFLAPLAASISTSSSSGAVSLNPISLGLAILDSEATLGSKPYIVVGGPCANTVALALMNNPTDCAAGFTEGKAMIKLFSEKNALLVAGYSGKDTQAACRVLASYKDPKYALSGTEMEVVTTNLQEPVVRKVSS